MKVAITTQVSKKRGNAVEEYRWDNEDNTEHEILTVARIVYERMTAKSHWIIAVSPYDSVNYTGLQFLMAELLDILGYPDIDKKVEVHEIRTTSPPIGLVLMFINRKIMNLEQLFTTIKSIETLSGFSSPDIPLEILEESNRFYILIAEPHTPTSNIIISFVKGLVDSYDTLTERGTVAKLKELGWDGS